MNHRSLWEKISVRKTSFPALIDSIEVDVVIIGGGITGATAAYELIKAGKKVAIVEAHKIGGVTTSHSTGNLYVPVQPLFQAIVKKYNINLAKKLADSRSSAIDYIEKNVKNLNIHCNFKRRPWYAYCSLDNKNEALNEFEILEKLAIPVERVKELPFGLKSETGFMIPNQARFNPLQYVISLCEELHEKGGLIYENTRVTQIQEDKICRVYTEQGKIVAKEVFMATHTPIGINFTQLYTAPYRSYVVGVELKEQNYPEANLWKLDSPRFAISTHAVSNSDPGILLVAGSHHKTGQTSPMSSHFDEIKNFIAQNFLNSTEEYSWSAQHYQPADDLPYIGPAGRASKKCFIATGYFADGLIFGTLAGNIIADLILNYPNASTDIFSSERFHPVASLPSLAKENLNVLTQYAKDLPQPAEKDQQFADLEPGQGKIIEVNREKIAICRDKENKLHKVSAVCTHMKCIVSWNDAEQTWDCPCHGNRFSTTGEVIEGPAIIHLKKLD